MCVCLCVADNGCLRDRDPPRPMFSRGIIKRDSVSYTLLVWYNRIANWFSHTILVGSSSLAVQFERKILHVYVCTASYPTMDLELKPLGASHLTERECNIWNAITWWRRRSTIGRAHNDFSFSFASLASSNVTQIEATRLECCCVHKSCATKDAPFDGFSSYFWPINCRSR